MDKKIKKLIKVLKMKNQDELRKDIKAYEEFYINDNYDYQEKGAIVWENFYDLLEMCKIEVVGKKERLDIIKQAVAMIV